MLINFIKRVVTIFKEKPIHFAVLPLLFILNNYIRLAGILELSDFIWPFFKTLTILLALTAFFYFLLKSFTRALILSSISGIIFFFFGNIKDTLYEIPFVSFISSYKFLLPLVLLFSVFVYLRIKKTKSVSDYHLFLNLLLLSYLVIEIFNWNHLKKINSLEDGGSHIHLKQAATGFRPNIYYIVMDGYPSSSILRERLAIRENFLDSHLRNKGFFVLENARSNYNYTTFSIHSMFYMHYIDWLKNISKPEPVHFSRSAVQIAKTPLINWLKQNGYNLFNLSIFDLPGTQSETPRKFFFVISPDVIFQHTIWNRIKWQLIPVLFPSFTKTLLETLKTNPKRSIREAREHNHKISDSLAILPSIQTEIPKFVYAHFTMPHSPYLYDSSGKQYPDSLIYINDPVQRKRIYAGFIAYTNNQILSISENILKKDKNALIIFQSDHGVRESFITPLMEDGCKNYSAFYFPDKDYKLLYDSMSNVNTFRIILNKYFNQQLPLLKDSSIYLQY
jgi:hypothetical protein